FIVERTSGASMPAQPSIDVKSNSVAEEPKIPSQSKPAAQPAAVAKSAVSSSELDAYLVNFVVEQTGYPEDMVELDADLEGDLGIDSIKKAQLLGELNEKFHFSTADDMNGATSLDDFATLRAIRDFIVERTSGASMPAQPSIDVKSNSVAEEPKIPSQSKPAAQSAAVAKSAVSSSELDAYLVNFVVEQTGYPEDMVELDADLEGDLGIDSIKKAQLLGELNEKFHFSTADDMNGATSLDDFATLRAIRDFIVERTSGVPTPTSQSSVSPEQQNIGSNNSESIDEKRKEILSYMKTFVVEQTGYPEDSVQIDYNLETDLGIDSIKKAQLFGELAEIYAVYPLADSSLEDYVTLRHIYDAVVKEL
ncbi:MAG: hypothetical protein IK077_06000, partial [Thermoguttaceae bacterium]|nr:hypothetical protein [Thermoguttaceae bacterium]